MGNREKNSVWRPSILERLGLYEDDRREDETQSSEDTIDNPTSQALSSNAGYIGHEEDQSGVPQYQVDPTAEVPQYRDDIPPVRADSGVVFIPNKSQHERQGVWDNLSACEITVSVFNNYTTDAEMEQPGAVMVRQLKVYGFSQTLHSEADLDDQDTKRLVERITGIFSNISNDSGYLPRMGHAIGCFDRDNQVNKVFILLRTLGMPRAFSTWQSDSLKTESMNLREEDFCAIFDMSEWQDGTFLEVPLVKPAPVQPEVYLEQATIPENGTSQQCGVVGGNTPQQLDFGGNRRALDPVSDGVIIAAIKAITTITEIATGSSAVSPPSTPHSGPAPRVAEPIMPTLGRSYGTNRRQQGVSLPDAPQVEKTVSRIEVQEPENDEPAKKVETSLDEAEKEILMPALVGDRRGVIGRIGDMSRKNRAIGGLVIAAVAVSGGFGAKEAFSGHNTGPTVKSFSFNQAENSIAANLKAGGAYAWSNDKVCFDNVAEVTGSGVVSLRIAQQDSKKQPAWIGDGMQSIDMNKAFTKLDACAVGREAIRFERSNDTTTAIIDMSKFTLSPEALSGSKVANTPIDIAGEQKSVQANIDKLKQMVAQEAHDVQYEKDHKSASPQKLAQDQKTLAQHNKDIKNYVPTFNETGQNKKVTFTLDELKAYNTNVSSQGFKNESGLLATTVLLARAQKDNAGLKTAAAQPYESLILSAAKEAGVKTIHVVVQNELPSLVDEFLSGANQSVKNPAGDTIQTAAEYHQGQVQAVVSQVKSKVVPQKAHPHIDDATAVKSKGGN